MANFRTSQWQDGDENLKCYEWTCHGIKRRFRKPKHTKKHIKKDSSGYFVEKFWNYTKPNLSSKLLREWSSRSIRSRIDISEIHDCELNSSPMILISNQMVYSWSKEIISLAFCPNPNNFLRLIWTKHAWNYSLISIVTIWLHIHIINLIL